MAGSLGGHTICRQNEASWEALEGSADDGGGPIELDGSSVPERSPRPWLMRTTTHVDALSRAVAPTTLETEEAMFDQLFESFRKASESSLQMHQEALRQWTQQWLTAPNAAASSSGEWSRELQKRWVDLTLELLNDHRTSLDSAYRSAIQAVEQTFRASNAKSPEEYRKVTEDIGRKLFENFKEQSETQFREFQKWSERTVDMVQKSQPQAAAT
jgi:hypothetical protein